MVWVLRKGAAYVDDWMKQNCLLIQVDENYVGAVPAYLQFREQYRGRVGEEILVSIQDLFLKKVVFLLHPNKPTNGKVIGRSWGRYLICGFDATVWPANACQVSNATSLMSNLLAMNSTHMGWVQYPVLQAQTTQVAMIKHRHLLDLSFLKESLTVQNNVQILYTKPEATARDSRNLCQSALATFHSSFLDASWQNSSAVKEGKIGPCPLIRVSDMQGFDDDARPNPSARAEQFLGWQVGLKFSTLLVCGCGVLRWLGCARTPTLPPTYGLIRSCFVGAACSLFGSQLLLNFVTVPDKSPKASD